MNKGNRFLYWKNSKLPVKNDRGQGQAGREGQSPAPASTTGWGYSLPAPCCLGPGLISSLSCPTARTLIGSANKALWTDGLMLFIIFNNAGTPQQAVLSVPPSLNTCNNCMKHNIPLHLTITSVSYIPIIHFYETYF